MLAWVRGWGRPLRDCDRWGDGGLSVCEVRSIAAVPDRRSCGLYHVRHVQRGRRTVRLAVGIAALLHPVQDVKQTVSGKNGDRLRAGDVSLIDTPPHNRDHGMVVVIEHAPMDRPHP